MVVEFYLFIGHYQSYVHLYFISKLLSYLPQFNTISSTLNLTFDIEF